MSSIDERLRELRESAEDLVAQITALQMVDLVEKAPELSLAERATVDRFGIFEGVSDDDDE